MGATMINRGFVSASAALYRAPKRNPGNRTELEQARALYRSFTGREAPRILYAPASKLTKVFPQNRAVVPVVGFGELSAVEYRANRDGRTDLYRHVFRRQSRPLLASSHDGTALYLLGGAYNFTNRGIVDR